MKRVLIIVLACLYCTGIYSQTLDEALTFIRLNEPNWACESKAHGTLLKRLEINLSDDKSTLIIKQKMANNTF